MNEMEADLRRERIVNANLAQRVGTLIAENIALMVRINELLESPEESDGPR